MKQIERRIERLEDLYDTVAGRRHADISDMEVARRLIFMGHPCQPENERKTWAQGLLRDLIERRKAL